MIWLNLDLNLRKENVLPTQINAEQKYVHYYSRNTVSYFSLQIIMR